MEEIHINKRDRKTHVKLKTPRKYFSNYKKHKRARPQSARNKKGFKLKYEGKRGELGNDAPYKSLRCVEQYVDLFKKAYHDKIEANKKCLGAVKFAITFVPEYKTMKRSKNDKWDNKKIPSLH